LPLCCRKENGFTSDPEKQAGPWGSYLCDAPPSVLDSMLDYIRDEIKPDLIFWTGDNPPHNVWEDDNAEVAINNIRITRRIQEKLKNTNISMFPIQGNHDTWPVNVQDFEEPYSHIQINSLAPLWLEWLEPETII